MFVKEVQLDLPQAFPAPEFTDLRRWARSMLLNPQEQTWSEFAGASNLVAWRFRAAFEGFDQYRSSWERLGVDVGFEKLYVRERALFMMFTSGVSCVDSLAYALFALLSDRRVQGIPFGEREQNSCNPNRLLAAVAKLSAPQLANALSVIVDAPEWITWKSFRNRMAHRSNLPRNLYAGNSVPPSRALDFAPTSSTSAYRGELEDLEGLLVWLAAQLRQVMAAVPRCPTRATRT